MSRRRRDHRTTITVPALQGRECSQRARKAAAIIARIAVITVTYDSGRIVAEFLESVQRAALAANVRAQIVIVDNDSSDDTVAVVSRRFPDVEVVPLASNVGYAAGLNVGLARVPADVPVLVANPDVRLERDAIRQLLRATRGQVDVGAVVPRLESTTGRRLPSQRRDPSIVGTLAEALLGGNLAGALGVGEMVTRPSAYARGRDVEWATGAALLMLPEGRRAARRWNESFFLYSEETELFGRLRDGGLRVRYCPSAHAVHIGGDLHASHDLSALRAVNRVRLYRQRHGAFRSALFWAANVVFEARRVVTGSVPARAALRALLQPDVEATASALVVRLRRPSPALGVNRAST